ncbi:MAG: carboxypeptidase-like regulatory domain-containing protein [bacterium]|nr:carboxypeptidase-like regulatory domain-containing protein [bacterium]
MNNGLILAARMHSCLATYNFNAYHYWWLWAAVSADNNEGLWRNDRTTRTKRFYVMGNYSKFVRPGFVRIAATVNPITDVLVTAYKSPTNGTFAIVVLNNSYAATNVTFNLSGFTATSVTPWLTDATRDLAAQTALTVNTTTFTAALPARSVTTFVGADATTYSISGTITNAATGAALATVVVSAGTRSATTDVNGAYSFSSVTNGTYTLTPMQSGYTFSPATRQVAVNGADQPGQDFAGVPEPALLLLPLLLLGCLESRHRRDHHWTLSVRYWIFSSDQDSGQKRFKAEN